MNLRHIREEIDRSLSSFGLVKTAVDVSLRALNRLVVLQIKKGIVIEKDDDRERVAPNDSRYQFQRLDEAALLPFARTPEYELSEAFLSEAFARGDECYGFLCDGQLAAYTWYTNKTTPIGLSEIAIHFSDRYVEIYKGFTHPAHRGHRLHGAGMTGALPVQLERGRQGLLSYVELTNYSQRHSAERAGFDYFGTLVICRLFGHYLLWASPECKTYDFHFVQGQADKSRALLSVPGIMGR